MYLFSTIKHQKKIVFDGEKNLTILEEILRSFISMISTVFLHLSMLHHGNYI